MLRSESMHHSESESVCSYSPGSTREQLNGHLEGHFEHQCDKCDYTSRTEGRLKQHIQRFHESDDYNEGKGMVSISLILSAICYCDISLPFTFHLQNRVRGLWFCDFGSIPYRQ